LPLHSYISHSIFAHKKALPIHSLEELRGNDVILLGRGVMHDYFVQADKMAALGILVSGMAHEINNPTGLIFLNLPTLSRAVADIVPILLSHYQTSGDFMVGGLPYSQMRSEVPAMLDEMHEAALRIKRIVEDLKHF
jgi:signal transduction histidine kinase